MNEWTKRITWATGIVIGLTLLAGQIKTLKWEIQAIMSNVEERDMGPSLEDRRVYEQELWRADVQAFIDSVRSR